MRAMILAAGRGERMRPQTDTTPKPLIKVGRLRLVEYQIIALQKAGVRSVVINVSWLAEQVRSVLGRGDRYGVEIIYSDESEMALETAGGIVQALPHLGGEPFIVCNADVWTDFDYAKLKLPDNYLAHLLVVANPAHHPDGDFSLQNNRLLRCIDETYTFSGIGIYRAEFFAGLAEGKRSLAPLLYTAIDNNSLSGEIHRGVWFDVGTSARLDQLENYLAAPHTGGVNK